MSNILIHYVVIHDKLGMQAQDGVGCDIASASVYWVMFLLLGAYIRRTSTFRDLPLDQRAAKTRCGDAKTTVHAEFAGGALTVSRGHLNLQRWTSARATVIKSP
ncbi:MAG TPA: hypothetical protein ACHBZA_11105 [Arsenophonus apicola]